MKYLTLILLLIYTPVIYAQDGNPIGIFTASKGQVTVTDESGTNQVTEGMDVNLGDTIETGEESGAKILFDDDSLFALGSDSSVTIDEFIYTPQERKSISNITKGKMRAIIQSVQSEESEIEIRTPNGLAGVKGTTLYANADEEIFCLRSGTIEVSGTKLGTTLVLSPDECTYIVDGDPIPPERISDETWLKFQRETDIYEGSDIISASYIQNYPGKNGSGSAPPLSTLINISQFPSIPPFNQSPIDNTIIPINVNVNVN